MPKGVYEVNDGKGIAGNHPAPQDASFKACLCTMLVLIALLLTIIFLVFPLKLNNPERYKTSYSSRSQADTEEVTGDKLKTPKQFEKYKEIDPTSTQATKVSSIISTLLQETVATKSTEMTGDERDITTIESARTKLTSKESTETKLESTTFSTKEESKLTTVKIPLITHTTELISSKNIEDDDIKTTTITEIENTLTKDTELESKSVSTKDENNPTSAKTPISSETTEIPGNEFYTSKTTESDNTIIPSEESSGTKLESTPVSTNEEIKPTTIVVPINSETTDIKGGELTTTTTTERDSTTKPFEESTGTKMESTPVSTNEEIKPTTIVVPINSETADIKGGEFTTTTTTERDSTTKPSEESTGTKLESTPVSTNDEIKPTTIAVPINSETTDIKGGEFTTTTTERDSTIIPSEKLTGTKLESTPVSTKDEIKPTTIAVPINSETTDIKGGEFTTTTTERDSTIIPSEKLTGTKLESTPVSTKDEIKPTTIAVPINSETTDIKGDEFTTTTTTERDSTIIVPKESIASELKSTSDLTQEEIKPTIAGIAISSESTKIKGNEFTTTTTEKGSTIITPKETIDGELKSSSASPKDEIKPTVAGIAISSESTKIKGNEFTTTTTEKGSTIITPKETIDGELKSSSASPKDEIKPTVAGIAISSESTKIKGNEFTTTTTEKGSTIITPKETTDGELKSSSASPKDEIKPTVAGIAISSESTKIKGNEFTTTTTEKGSTIITPKETIDGELKSSSASPKDEIKPTVAGIAISSESTKIKGNEFTTTTTEKGSTIITPKETTDGELKSSSASPKDEIKPTVAGIAISSESTKIKGNEFTTTTTEKSSTIITPKETIDGELKSSSASPKDEIKPTTEIIYELKAERKTTIDTSKFPVTTESSSISTKPTIPAPKVCVSDSCKVTASRMLSLINHTQDPCEDFYKFACGGLRKTPTLLEDNIADDVSKRLSKELKKVNMSSFIVYNKLKTYYQSCIDYDQNVPMDKRKKQGQDLFHSIGSMVVSGIPKVSLTDVLISLFHHGSAPLFDISLDVDPKHTSNFTFVVTQPKWTTSLFKSEKDTTSHCRYKPDDNINSELNEAYSIYIQCLKNHSKFFDRVQEAMEAFNVFDVDNATLLIQETRLAIEWDVLELIELLPTTKEVNLALQKKASVERNVGQLWNNSLIEWGPLLEALFNVTVSNETTVQVYFDDYMEDLASELKKKDSRKLHNALLGIFAHSLYTDLVKTNHPCNRDQYCLTVATGLMPQVASNIYLQSFSSDLKEMCNKTSQIFDSLLSTMKEQVKNATWMDEETTNAVLQKLDSMTLWLPNFFFDDHKLDHTFAEVGSVLMLVESEQFTPYNYLIDSVTLTKIYQRNLYSHYKLNPQSAEAIWSHFLTSFSTKTLYIYRTNTLVVPLSLLTPLLDTSVPSYVTIAKTGYYLAQGIAHGFEETGITYKWNGLGGDIISPGSYEMYKSSVDISKELYHYKKTQKEDKVYSMLLNTYQTLNSRLSDVTAAKLALETARKNGMEERLPYANFTADQTFHLILLQGFCTKKMIPESVPELFESDDLPEYLRLNYIAQNMEDFGTAFYCNTGSTMNPTMRSEPFPLFKDISEIYPDTYSEVPEN